MNEFDVDTLGIEKENDEENKREEERRQHEKELKFLNKLMEENDLDRHDD